MKKVFLLSVLLSIFIGLNAQKTNDKGGQGYIFKEDFRLPATPVKNQYRSGTCWSFSSLSFMESEMLRIGKKNVDLSEMFVVNKCYYDKADLYVRMHGNMNFAGGGAFHDIPYVMEHYGLMPEEAYIGLCYGTEKHVHGELDAVLKGFVDAVVKNGNKKLSSAWKKACKGILTAYLGEVPEKFTFEGKEYTARTFADEYVGLKYDDYIEISSFSHHPFYEKFILEVPDNWLFDKVYNVPLNELEGIIDYALKNGYTIAWGADVSHKGANFQKGVAVIPETDVESMDGLEQDKWDNMSKAQREQEIYKLDNPVKEKEINQEMRQEAFDDYSTTDDHGMHIIGMAKDQKGTKFYIVKNSWGANGVGPYDGYFYASRSFILMQTLDIMIHKDALSKEIKKKLNI